MQITKDQDRAVGDFVDLIASRLGQGRAIHPETAIASSARISGSLLLRSFGFDLESQEPGDVLLSNEANERGPRLINLLGTYLTNNKVELDLKKVNGTPEQRGAEPKLNTQESLVLLQTNALKIAAQHSLSLQQAAEAAALATGFIVKECAKSIGAETGFNVAGYGFIEGSKTIPPHLEKSSQPPTSKPWYRFW